MGRHSRRGPAPKGDTADTAAARGARDAAEARYDERWDARHAAAQAQQRTHRPQPGAEQGHGPSHDGSSTGTPPQGTPVPGYGTPGHGRPGQGVPPLPDGWQQDGTPARGVPRHGGGTPARGTPRFGDPAQGAPRYGDGTPPRGVPRYGDGTPPRGVPQYGEAPSARGVPRPGDGTPAQGMPRRGDGTPPPGVPRYGDGTPAHGTPQVRGGHPEQQEPGDGWGTLHGRTAAGAGHGAQAAGQGVPLPRQRRAHPEGPRRDYVEAFDGTDDLFTPRKPVTRGPAHPHGTATDRDSTPATGVPSDTGTADDEPPTGVPAQTRGGKGRAFTGIAAAAVTTVLAVVVAGQVADEHDTPRVQAQSAGEQARDARDSASRGIDRGTSGAATPRPLTYEQKMDRKFRPAATRAGTGKFDAVRGIDKAPGKGRKITYRVDVERGLDLDGALFAEAVHRTLNDRRSWAHDGLAFERIESGQPDFVITLASPETTADWCAKSGLDTTQDNVSCDSAATERVLINAFRWAQGAETYGDEMFAYRQMLINHEVGHRLGHNHVTCDKDGDLAPVMQQQTKFLDHDGISCRPNPWPYPKG
ncbi:DUF3152 domain-containing protein [Streptomyces sp. MA15]|uniref:DUF3152 domain-containing protein n=1 Tax=Streptomyces sp. MA15 TaxID=3055061 RepID=UPI0025B08940|nr:DUF3152 domain-containing protein [Streptomyces sp. MA15]MDN3271766.1 DUF3152 domain-containing protein [Streptomyces sp. MA15]